MLIVASLAALTLALGESFDRIYNQTEDMADIYWNACLYPSGPSLSHTPRVSASNLMLQSWKQAR